MIRRYYAINAVNQEWIYRAFSSLISSQDTPNPGVYHIRDFIEEADLNPVKKTYGFKRVGRKPATLGTQRGHMLLPGASSFPESEVQKPSFFFKACPRREVTLGVRDKVGFRTTPHPSGAINGSFKCVPCCLKTRRSGSNLLAVPQTEAKRVFLGHVPAETVY